MRLDDITLFVAHVIASPLRVLDTQNLTVYDRKLMVEDLAGIAFLSVSHFKKIFKLSTGENVSDYINRIRLEKARFMLLENDSASVTEIALDTGFSSSATFARAFKNYFGISASDFRKQESWNRYTSFSMPFLNTFTPVEYDGEEAILSIAFGTDDTVYFGAYEGELLLLKNGTWNKMIFPELQDIYSLDTDNEGILYAGGRGEFGYFIDDDSGFHYVSLADRLDESQKNFHIVWRTVCSHNGVYFMSRSFIFRWFRETLTVTEGGVFYSMMGVGSAVYLLQQKVGMMQITDGRVELAPGGERVAKEHINITCFLPYDDERIICYSRNHGFFLYDGAKLEKFSTNADSLFIECGGMRAAHIPGKGYAVGTRVGGVIIVSYDGRLIGHMDKKRGLPDNHVRSMRTDSMGRFWMGLSFGLAMTEVFSPAIIFNEQSGIKGRIESMCRYRGNLYLGTVYGVQAEDHTYLSGNNLFLKLPWTNEQVWDLMEYREDLIISYCFGLYILSDKTVSNINLDLDIYSVCGSIFHDGIVFGAATGKVILFKKNKKWDVFSEIEALPVTVNSMTEDGKGRLWLSYESGDIVQITFHSEDCSEYEMKFFKIEASPLYSGVIHFSVDNENFFCTRNGMFNFSESESGFTAATVFGSFFEEKIVHYMTQDFSGNVWFIAGRDRKVYVAEVLENGDYRTGSTPVFNDPDLRAYSLYVDKGGIVWIGCNDQLIRFDPAEAQDKK